MRCDRRLEREGHPQCTRTRGHIGECRSLTDIRGHAGDRRIVDDPDAPTLPHGCINIEALEALAVTMAKLDDYHLEHDGVQRDRPCLRRLESADGVITAHVSSGPAIGGSWIRLELVRGKWVERSQ